MVCVTYPAVSLYLHCTATEQVLNVIKETEGTTSTTAEASPAPVARMDGTPLAGLHATYPPTPPSTLVATPVALLTISLSPP